LESRFSAVVHASSNVWETCRSLGRIGNDTTTEFVAALGRSDERRTESSRSDTRERRTRSITTNATADDEIIVVIREYVTTISPATITFTEDDIQEDEDRRSSVRTRQAWGIACRVVVVVVVVVVIIDWTSIESTDDLRACQ